MIALDMIGNEVRVGDTLADARGKTFVVELTEASLIRAGMVRVRFARRPRERASLLLAFAVRLNDESKRLYPNELRELYARLYDMNVRQESRERLRQRKQRINAPASHGQFGI